MRVCPCVLALLVLAACSTQHPSRAPPPTAQAPQEVTLAQQVDWGVLVESKRHESEEADKVLRAVIENPGFAGLDPVHRHRALQMDAIAALELGDLPRGLALIRRACAMTQTDARDWFARLEADEVLRQPQDEALSLTQLARRWPTKIRGLQSERALEPAVAAAEAYASDSDLYVILIAVAAADLPTEPAHASAWWRDLALLQLARGENDPAARMLLRVVNPYVAISIAADKRFDPLRRDLANRLDPEKLAQQGIEAALDDAKRNPELLEPLDRLGQRLEVAQRYRQMLQVTDSVIEQLETRGHSGIADYDREYRSILDHRAAALYNLGRWDAAMTQLEAARALPGPAGANVNQVINLANAYAELGRPAQALATLKELRPGETNMQGDIAVSLARLSVAVQQHESKTQGDELAFLKAHRLENPGAYQFALLTVDAQEEGARFMISRLQDARRRDGALVALQGYNEEFLPRMAEQCERRWQTLTARSDVRAATRRFGTTRSYALERDDY